MNEEMATKTMNNKKAWKEMLDKLVISSQNEKSEKIEISDICNVHDFRESKSESNNQIYVRVFHEDLLTTFHAVVQIPGYRPLLVNSCEELFPVEALKTGAEGTEYDILRSTNYYNTINREMFPIKDSVIFSQKLHLLRYGKKWQTNPKQFSMVSISPIKNPPLISRYISGVMESTYYDQRDEQNAENKIKSIFYLAEKNNNNCIIVNDFGCKKENNPIHSTVENFNRYIHSSRFHEENEKSVKYVFFSIKNVNNINKDENFLYFHKNIKRN